MTIQAYIDQQLSVTEIQKNFGVMRNMLKKQNFVVGMKNYQPEMVIVTPAYFAELQRIQEDFLDTLALNEAIRNESDAAGVSLSDFRDQLKKQGRSPDA